MSSYSICSLHPPPSADPSWGSCSLGVFICLACSGIHRNIPDVSKVKSLSLSHWEDHEVQVRPQEPAENALDLLYFYESSYQTHSKNENE